MALLAPFNDFIQAIKTAVKDKKDEKIMVGDVIAEAHNIHADNETVIVYKDDAKIKSTERVLASITDTKDEDTAKVRDDILSAPHISLFWGKGEHRVKVSRVDILRRQLEDIPAFINKIIESMIKTSDGKTNTYHYISGDNIVANAQDPQRLYYVFETDDDLDEDANRTRENSEYFRLYEDTIPLFLQSPSPDINLLQRQKVLAASEARVGKDASSIVESLLFTKTG